MLLLTTLIHAIFAAIFFFFHRYIEMGVVMFVWIVVVSKIIPPLDFFRRPKFLKKKMPENDTFEHSLYISAWILFYTALVGLALGIANVLGIPVDLHLLYYCVFFLTGVIYWIYLLFYPRNPTTFVIFRTHTMIASTVLSLLVLSGLIFGLNEIDIFLIANLFLLIIGLIVVIVLDRNIPLGGHISAVYFFLVSVLCFVSWGVSMFHPPLSILLMSIIVTLILLYLISPRFIEDIYQKSHKILVSWHFSNGVLALTWALFGYVFWWLFWWPESQAFFTCLNLFLLTGIWSWVYLSDHHNPIFFTGIVAAISTLYGYVTFMILPANFWFITAALFVYGWSLLLISRGYRERTEELILGGSAVFFLCISDLVLIFQDNNLFALSLLFLLESLIWYGAYEIFHRHASKDPTL